LHDVFGVGVVTQVNLPLNVLVACSAVFLTEVKRHELGDVVSRVRDVGRGVNERIELDVESSERELVLVEGVLCLIFDRHHVFNLLVDSVAVSTESLKLNDRVIRDDDDDGEGEKSAEASGLLDFALPAKINLSAE